MAHVDQHRRQANRYFANAEKFLARGRLEKASELFWGAAAQAMKAVAEKRGWRHGAHNLLRDCAQRLEAELGEFRVGSGWNAAELLHGNFYELNGSCRWVRWQARQVRGLVRRLAQI